MNGAPIDSRGAAALGLLRFFAAFTVRLRRAIQSTHILIGVPKKRQITAATERSEPEAKPEMANGKWPARKGSPKGGSGGDRQSKGGCAAVIAGP